MFGFTHSPSKSHGYVRLSLTWISFTDEFLDTYFGTQGSSGCSIINSKDTEGFVDTIDQFHGADGYFKSNFSKVLILYYQSILVETMRG